MGSRTTMFRRLSRCNRAAGDPLGHLPATARRVPSVARGQQARARAARWVFVATLLALMSFASAVRASEAQGSEGRASEGREGWTFDIRLGAGVASNTYDESDRPVADFEAFAVAGALRLGGFIGPHVLLGGELAVGWGGRAGELRVQDPEYFSDGYPRGSSYGYFAPLGVFIELYPWRNEGVFVSASGGVGVTQLPSFSPGDYEAFMSRYAFELGYELSRTGKLGPAVYLHFERWAGSETPLSTDYPAGLVSTQLLAGLRWTL
jgi:hypothetical protein